MIFFKNEPPTPACIFEKTEEEISFKEANKRLFSNKHFLYVFIYFAFVYGIFNTLTTLINYLIVPFGFSDVYLGLKV